MDRLCRYADLSVKRACGFGLLAVVTAVIGLSPDPAQALRVAALMFAVQTLLLWAFAAKAHRRPYRRREVWVLLDYHHGLPEHRAQEIISEVMRLTFLAYAERSALAAMACWLALAFLMG